jgi:hypothetical protein
VAFASSKGRMVVFAIACEMPSRMDANNGCHRDPKKPHCSNIPPVATPAACYCVKQQRTSQQRQMEGELRTLARSQWSSKNAWNLLRDGLGWNKPIAPGQGTLRPIRINHKDGKHGSGVFALREPAIEAMSCGCGASRTSLG